MNLQAHSTEQRSSRLDAISQVRVADLKRLDTHAQDVMAKAMELTDAWGQAMFVMDPQLVAAVFSALGFSADVCANVYDAVRGLAYVSHRQQGLANQAEVTWHGMDATCLTLRGAVGLESALAGVNDGNVEHILERNRDLFDTIMKVVPDYTRKLMFSPEVAATVMSCFGAKVSADAIHDLAWRYGGQTTLDLDGRRGVATQFIRALTLTICARI
ncbi:MAG: hypothetical protein E6J90_08990 [Deltaproteobacteria bacterium]|nr:MAG: hypothetical protein E6J90_08990 [Deltaproteobacteria bacterium]